MTCIYSAEKIFLILCTKEVYKTALWE